MVQINLVYKDSHQEKIVDISADKPKKVKHLAVIARRKFGEIGLDCEFILLFKDEQIDLNDDEMPLQQYYKDVDSIEIRMVPKNNNSLQSPRTKSKSKYHDDFEVIGGSHIECSNMIDKTQNTPQKIKKTQSESHQNTSPTNQILNENMELDRLIDQSIISNQEKEMMVSESDLDRKFKENELNHIQEIAKQEFEVQLKEIEKIYTVELTKKTEEQKLLKDQNTEMNNDLQWSRAALEKNKQDITWLEEALEQCKKDKEQAEKNVDELTNGQFAQIQEYEAKLQNAYNERDQLKKEYADKCVKYDDKIDMLEEQIEKNEKMIEKMEKDVEDNRFNYIELENEHKKTLEERQNFCNELNAQTEVFEQMKENFEVHKVDCKSHMAIQQELKVMIDQMNSNEVELIKSLKKTENENDELKESLKEYNGVTDSLKKDMVELQHKFVVSEKKQMTLASEYEIALTTSEQYSNNLKEKISQLESDLATTDNKIQELHSELTSNLEKFNKSDQEKANTIIILEEELELSKQDKKSVTHNLDLVNQETNGLQNQLEKLNSEKDYLLQEKLDTQKILEGNTILIESINCKVCELEENLLEEQRFLKKEKEENLAQQELIHFKDLEQMNKIKDLEIDNKKYRERVDQLEGQVTGINSEFDVVKSELINMNEVKRKLSILEENNMELEEEKDNLLTDISDKSNAVKGLKDELEYLYKDKEVLELALKKFEEDLINTSQAIASEKEISMNKDMMLRKMEEESFIEINATRKESDEMNQKFIENIDFLKQDLNLKNNEIDDKEKALADKEEELQKIERNYKDAIETLEAENTKLKENKADLDTQIEKFERSMDEMKQNLKQKEEEIQNLTKQISESEKNHDDEYSKFEKKLTDVEQSFCHDFDEKVEKIREEEQDKLMEAEADIMQNYKKREMVLRKEQKEKLVEQEQKALRAEKKVDMYKNMMSKIKNGEVNKLDGVSPSDKVVFVGARHSSATQVMSNLEPADSVAIDEEEGKLASDFMSLTAQHEADKLELIKTKEELELLKKEKHEHLEVSQKMAEAIPQTELVKVKLENEKARSNLEEKIRLFTVENSNLRNHNEQMSNDMCALQEQMLAIRLSEQAFQQKAAEDQNESSIFKNDNEMLEKINHQTEKALEDEKKLTQNLENTLEETVMAMDNKEKECNQVLTQQMLDNEKEKDDLKKFYLAEIDTLKAQLLNQGQPIKNMTSLYDNAGLALGNTYMREKHDRIVCDSCYTCPIMGERYKDLVRPGYDLCKNCYDTHGNENPVLKFQTPTAISPEKLEDALPLIKVLIKENYEGKFEIEMNNGFKR